MSQDKNKLNKLLNDAIKPFGKVDFDPADGTIKALKLDETTEISPSPEKKIKYDDGPGRYQPIKKPKSKD